MSSDFQVSPAAFSATTFAVKATSEAGRRFLSERVAVGAVGFDIPKSSLPEFMAAAKAAGLAVV